MELNSNNSGTIYFKGNVMNRFEFLKITKFPLVVCKFRNSKYVGINLALKTTSNEVTNLEILLFFFLRE